MVLSEALQGLILPPFSLQQHFYTYFLFLKDMRLLILMGVMMMVLSAMAIAAEIHGSVYTPSLQKVRNVIVEIDSSPMQRLVSNTGEYSFKVSPEREYTITVWLKEEIIAKEIVSVDEEGSFVVDMFVLPDFAEEDLILAEADEPELDEGLFEGAGRSEWVLVGIIVLVVIGAGALLYKKNEKGATTLVREKIGGEEKVSPDVEGVLQVMKEQGGRITQKELRKHFPLSEAKVSLLLTELEAKGKIEKIKKGRGNIILLK